MLRIIKLVVLAALVACNAPDDPIDPPTSQGAAHLDIASGNNQTAAINTAVPSPLSVIVTDVKGGPVANVEVEWAVMSGGGSLTASSALTNQNGVASVGWTLGSAVGSQTVKGAVAGLSFAAVFAATALAAPSGPAFNTGGSVILRYDGATWTTSLADGNGVGLSYTAIWGASANRIFAVGKCRGVPIISTYDGTRWSIPTETACSGSTLSTYTSVWGNSAADVFSVRHDPLPPSLNTSVQHYNGQTWASVLFRQCSFCGGYNAVWSSGPNDAIVVGDSGLIARFDGSKWNPQESGTKSHLRAVWSPGVASAVFAVGDDGTIVTYTGAAAGWQPQASGTTASLKAVWGTSATDVFAVGAGGTILHFDGISWTSLAGATTHDLYGVWGSAPNSVFVVGSGSTIIRYNGSIWSAQQVNTTIDLAGIWGSSGSNVFAVGTAIYP